jgi:hypothetical protein
MKGWRDRAGKRWYTSEHERVSRLFRYHVNTRGNPRGRIHRMMCAFCKVNEQDSISQFHHLDYARPFVGVWVCVSHHRKIEAGTAKVTPSKVFDYTGLVAPLLRAATSKALRDHAARRNSDVVLRPTGSTPF